MRLFPKSIERIIAENRLTDAIFRRTWSWKDYTFQYVYIGVIIAILVVFDYSMRILWVPLWVYGLVCIMYIAVRIAFNISINKKAAEKEDKLIEYILNEAHADDQVYCNEELKEKLLLQSRMRVAHATFGQMDSLNDQH
jgi:ABC-type transport system involved in Fe-S cluster assembly fused permease/ATPase subunit